MPTSLNPLIIQVKTNYLSQTGLQTGMCYRWWLYKPGCSLTPRPLKCTAHLTGKCFLCKALIMCCKQGLKTGKIPLIHISLKHNRVTRPLCFPSDGTQFAGNQNRIGCPSQNEKKEKHTHQSNFCLFSCWSASNSTSENAFCFCLFHFFSPHRAMEAKPTCFWASKVIKNWLL